jgi:septal ring factor EnvC (AmiA/AmiB activator)
MSKIAGNTCLARSGACCQVEGSHIERAAIDINQIKQQFDSCLLENSFAVILMPLANRRNGEGLTIVSEGQERLEKRFDGLEKKVDRLEIRFDGLETRFDGLETRFDGLEKKVGEIDARLISVQDDVMEIKHKLSEKVDLADFQKLEKRMVKLEKLVLSTR